MAAEVIKVEPAESEQDEEEDVYEVERIIDMRVEEGEVLYRVRWKNYCSDDDTWEPEAHLEDCREVLLAFKKAVAEAKAKKEAEAKKPVKVLPSKSDVFDADSESDSDKDRPTDAPIKKKKKKTIREEAEEEEPVLKDKKKKKKKKDKLKDEVKPLPAPETEDEEEEEEEEEKVPVLPSPPKERSSESKKRVVESEEETDELVPSKKHKKEKGKEGLKHKKEKGEGRKKKGKKDRKLETSEDEVAAPLEDDLSEGLSESQMDDAPAVDTVTKPVEKVALDEKSKQVKGKWEVKLQGIKDLIQDKRAGKKQDATTKESSVPKQKSTASKSKEDVAQSDSSDSSSLPKKAKSKGQESTASSLKVASSSASSASSSSSVTAAGTGRAKEDGVTKEEPLGQKDASGSSNLFEKFLLNCEAKDRAPRRPPAHPSAPEKSNSKPLKLGKIEKIAKPAKESPAQKAESEKAEKTKQSDVPRTGPSHGFNLDSDEKEESSGKPKPSDDSRERRERPEEAQRLNWERRTSADDRKKRREDTEPRLFIACDDGQDPPESADKSDKGQTTLSLGMDLNLDWMTLDDFQKHLNGEDEILSGPPLSPSELRDAVKSGDYMAVKLALNSKEDYNLDQEECTIGEKRSFEGERSLIEDRNSSSSLRLTSNFDSARNEEFTPKEIFLQELDGLKNDKMPTCPAGTNSEQVTESELESFEKVFNKITESAAHDSAIKHGGPVNEVQETKEDKMLTDSRGDITSNHILNIDNSDLTGNVEGVETQQDSHKEANDSSDEAEDAEPGGSDSTHRPSESSAKEVVEGPLRSHKKSLEKRHPTRSSQRTCKKVIEIPPEITADDEKMDFSRKHFCLYCKLSFIQLTKHLEKKHAEETAVAHAIHFPKGSKVRQTLLDEIRKKGDYEHNNQVLKGVDIDIVNFKKPTISGRDFLPCKHCFTFYRKTDLWRHEQSCKARGGDPKPTEKAHKNDNHNTVSQLLPVSDFLTESCKEIIHTMHQDEISAHVRSDPLICKYGNALAVKYGYDKSQFPYIAQKMRELGRFVFAVNEIDRSVKHLHEICLPSKFGLAVEGVKKLSGFDPSSSTYKTISLVSKIGYSLKRAAEIAFGESRMTEDGETETQMKTFIHLLDTKWNGCFSRKALSLSPREEVKKAEVDKSTVTEDLIKLYMFIMGEEDDARRELKESPSLSTWKKLSEATLADVCLFNRGRVGNIGRLLSKTYMLKKSSEAFLLSADQVRKSTKLELDLGSSFTRLELEGQYGRNMLVLLSKGMVSSIDLLVENRERAGVSKANPYLFARTEGPSFIRALDCFRRAAMECGVKNPEALLSSSLREQIACCWQLMSLNEVELDRVAKLVGRTSQECYMLSKHPSLLEEVSKQLLKLDRTWPRSPLNNAKDGNVQKPALKRRPWSEKEQTAVKRGLSEFITMMKVPGKKECNACIAAEPDLEGRSWTDVKNYVHNTLQTMRRRNNQQKSERSTYVSKSSKAEVQTARTNLEDTIMCNMTTVHPDHLRETLTMPSHTELRDSSLFAQEMTPTYATLCSTSANMIHLSQPLISSFTPLNATDTQVVPTFTPHNTTNAPMPPTYSLDNKLLPMSSLYSQITTTLSTPSVYASPDTTVSPVLPSFTSLTAPSTSMVPTFTHLNAPNTSVMPTFSSLDDSTRPIVSSFTALNSSDVPAYPTSPPQVLTTAQVVPTIHGSNVSDRAPGTQQSSPMSSAGIQPSPDSKPQKRIKRLWSEEEQTAVRRQLGDFCKLVKVPGKKECDACLAAEPALNTRTWREVKYFVHNSIQSLKRRGHTVASKQNEPEPETHNLTSEWDGPVYLSL